MFLVSEGYVREGRIGLSHTDYAQVSKRWKEIFTQKDILFYCARTISPKPCFGLPPAQLEGIIKRQARLEIGQPVITATLKDLSWSPQDREDRLFSRTTMYATENLHIFNTTQHTPCYV